MTSHYDVSNNTASFEDPLRLAVIQEIMSVLAFKTAAIAYDRGRLIVMYKVAYDRGRLTLLMTEGD